MTLNDLSTKIKNISENYKEEPIAGWITGDGPIPCNILLLVKPQVKMKLK